ncbi:MAG TPA: FAD-dependent oxidoreductase [Actinospica sp.]|jgi:protoporphyrinogen oxidase|nr:FAD-dependent oxidoreductase [Actinospica sp.]
MTSASGLVVLGAGPAGLAAAYSAARRGHRVTVLERSDAVGGLSASFEVAGIRVDHGSHRLNPDLPPHVLADLRALLGADLQTRYRTGRLLLGERWVAYPFKPREIAKALPAAPMAKAAFDALASRHRATDAAGAGNYADAMRAGFGTTLYDLVYEPYARKLWGISGQQVDADQARRKAGAPTAWAALIRSVRSALATESLAYLYPRRGFGQLCETLAEAAVTAGARVRLGTAVEQITADTHGITVSTARSEHYGSISTRGAWFTDDRSAPHTAVHAAHVFSTIPLPLLARITTPAPAFETIEAGAALRFRALLLVYAVHEGGRWTNHDVHYIPGGHTPVTRISEPANHRINPDDPEDRSVVCFEIPCEIGDETWSADERQLSTLITETVAHSHLPPMRLAWIQVKRLRQGYPVHHLGYRQHLDVLETWAASVPRLTTFGRQGLFTPDNVHHALAMGYQATDALGDTGFDQQRWGAARESFGAHLVES